MRGGSKALLTSPAVLALPLAQTLVAISVVVTDLRARPTKAPESSNLAQVLAHTAHAASAPVLILMICARSAPKKPPNVSKSTKRRSKRKPPPKLSKPQKPSSPPPRRKRPLALPLPHTSPRAKKMT